MRQSHSRRLGASSCLTVPSEQARETEMSGGGVSTGWHSSPISSDSLDEGRMRGQSVHGGNGGSRGHLSLEMPRGSTGMLLCETSSWTNDSNSNKLHVHDRKNETSTPNGPLWFEQCGDG